MKASTVREFLFSGECDQRLSSLGGRPAAAERQRYAELTDLFISAFGDRDVYLFSSPGRSEICGNHTDHNNGKALGCAVNLDIIAAAARNGDGHIRVRSVGFDVIDIDTSSLDPSPDETGDAAGLVRGVAAGMKNLGREVGGFDAVTVSRVPPGSGLSSSAAFEVLLAKILDTLYNDGSLDPTRSAVLSRKAETDYFGKPCGLLDQLICASGGLVKADFRDPAAPASEKLTFDLSSAGYSLFVVNTGGSHADLTGDYAAIAGEMRRVAAYFGRDVLRECDEQGFFSNLAAVRSKCGDRAVLRAAHFFSENARVDAQYAALSRGDMREFLRLVNLSGDSSAMFLQNAYSLSSPSSQGIPLGIYLGRRALDGEGAVRLQGGGFAGTVQAFVPFSRREAFVSSMSAVFGAPAVMELNIRSDGLVCVLR